MDAEPTHEGRAGAREGTTELPLAAPEPEVADSPARGLLNTFTRLARFSPHTRRWHAIDRTSGGRGDRAGDDMPSGER